jgi:hypothetical protein
MKRVFFPNIKKIIIYELFFFLKNSLIFGIKNSSNKDIKKPNASPDLIAMDKFLLVSK